MRQAGADLLVAPCAGAPGQVGWVRYLTGAPLWGPRTFVVVALGSSRRTLVTRAPDDTNWYRLTTVDTDIESTLTQRITPLDRLLEIIRAHLDAGGRLGIVNPGMCSPVEAAAIRGLVSDARTADLTRPLWRLRRIKTAFEIGAMRRTGTLLAQALDRFAATARPGRSAMEVAGEIDGFLRSEGSPYGHLRYAFDQDPMPGPPVGARRFEPEDVVAVHLAYAGPLGYWGELTGVFSFRPLPPAARRRVETAAKALRRAARALGSGRTPQDVEAAAARAYESARVAVTGRHGPDVHTIGADEDEDWSSAESPDAFEQGMTVAVHPAPVPADGRGFFLARTFLVGASGPVALAPSRPPYREIPGP
jgi:Xaa-Pro aminopeptidase